MRLFPDKLTFWSWVYNSSNITLLYLLSFLLVFDTNSYSVVYPDLKLVSSPPTSVLQMQVLQVWATMPVCNHFLRGRDQ